MIRLTVSALVLLVVGAIGLVAAAQRDFARATEWRGEGFVDAQFASY